MTAALRGLAFAVLALGCATGGKDGGGEGQPVDAGSTDARPLADAPAAIDARVTPIDAATPDATPSMTPDAATGPFCSTNAQCTVAGECCVTLGGPQGFCAPGDVVFGQCFPQ